MITEYGVSHGSGGQAGVQVPLKSKKKTRRSATFANNAFTFRDGELKLAKTSAPLNIVWHRPLPEGAVPSTATVSCDGAGRWFVSILAEETIAPLPSTDAAVGIDAGLTHLVTQGAVT